MEENCTMCSMVVLVRLLDLTGKKHIVVRDYSNPRTLGARSSRYEW